MPELTAEDESGLRDGLLSMQSAAGRRHRLGRTRLDGPQGRSCPRGGQCPRLCACRCDQGASRAGLDFDYIAGTSVGAAVAGLLALGNDHDQIADILDEFSPTLFRSEDPVHELPLRPRHEVLPAEHGARRPHRGPRDAVGPGRGGHRHPARTGPSPRAALAGGARQHCDSRRLSGPEDRASRCGRRRRLEPAPREHRSRDGRRDGDRRQPRRRCRDAASRTSRPSPQAAGPRLCSAFSHARST